MKNLIPAIVLVVVYVLYCLGNRLSVTFQKVDRLLDEGAGAVEDVRRLFNSAHSLLERLKHETKLDSSHSGSSLSGELIQPAATDASTVESTDGLQSSDGEVRPVVGTSRRTKGTTSDIGLYWREIGATGGKASGKTSSR